jgi:hypothetical protein
MARLGYYGHFSPVPANRSPDDRVRNAGWDGGRAYKELLAQADSADAAFRSWEAKDLLDRSFTVAGVGRNGRYFVLLLGAP